MKKRLSLLLLLTSTACLADEQTVFQVLGQVNFNGDLNEAFFLGGQKWGAPTCPNATYVKVSSSVAGRKELLSIALAAKMAVKRVQFWGVCDANKDYFNAMYIVVE